MSSGRVIDARFLTSSQLPFGISLAAIIAIIILVIVQSFFYLNFGSFINKEDSAFVRAVAPNAIYIALFLITLFGAYIGYRLVVAAGATSTVVIPPQDYQLLAPLISDGKTESIDQYVRLSSLAKFTGTFTQLGLTGLPLATIAMTLFFSIMALAKPDDFLDLAKLTLGAFIGSFVQRQVERRAEGRDEKKPGVLDELSVPPAS